MWSVSWRLCLEARRLSGDADRVGQTDALRSKTVLSILPVIILFDFSSGNNNYDAMRDID